MTTQSWSPTPTGNGSGYNGDTLRAKINLSAASVTITPTWIQIFLPSTYGGSNSWTVTKCYAGAAASGGSGLDFTTTPTQVTFGGNASGTVPTSGGLWSDVIPISSLTSSSNLIISFLSGTSIIPGLLLDGTIATRCGFGSGDQAGSVTVVSLTTSSGYEPGATGFTVGDSPLNTLASTQNPNTCAASGGVAVSGTIADTQTQNIAAIVGATAGPLTGTITATQSSNICAVSGAVTITGTLSGAQSPDVFSGSGSFTTSAFVALLNNPVPSFAGWASFDTINGVLKEPVAAFYGGSHLAATLEEPTASFTGAVGVSGFTSALLEEPIGSFTGSANLVVSIKALLENPTGSLTGFGCQVGIMNSRGESPAASFIGDLGLAGGNALNSLIENPIASFTDNFDPTLADDYGILKYRCKEHPPDREVIGLNILSAIGNDPIPNFYE